MRLSTTFLASVLALLFASCGGMPASVAPSPSGGGTEHSEPRVDDEATWARLASRPRNHHVARTSVVKFVIDMRAEAPSFHFLESTRYESHYAFVEEMLAPGVFADGMDFYAQVYRVEDRPYVVGSIVRYEDANAWTFELISGDNLSGARILETYRALRGRTFFGDDRALQPEPERADSAARGGARADPSGRGGPLGLGAAHGRGRLERGGRRDAADA